MKLKSLLIVVALVGSERAGLGAEAIALLPGSPVCCAKETAATEPLSDRSLYQVDSTWTNDAGVAVRLASLRGRPQVITMFFATCEYACPILVHDMKRIEAALPENIRGDVGFVLVSFDSERDTSAALAAYRKNHQLGSNWTLLRGAPDDVLEIGALLGVKFKKDARGQFAHSNIITVLDARGQIVHQRLGLNQDVVTAVKAIERAASKKPHPRAVGDLPPGGRAGVYIDLSPERAPLD